MRASRNIFRRRSLSNKEIVVGGIHSGDRETLNGSKWMNFPELAKIEVKPSSDEGISRHSLFYAQSWLLVHYIFQSTQVAASGELL